MISLSIELRDNKYPPYWAQQHCEYRSTIVDDVYNALVTIKEQLRENKYG